MAAARAPSPCRRHDEAGAEPADAGVLPGTPPPSSTGAARRRGWWTQAPARPDTLVERGAGYYLVLVASDVPQDARHLRLRLAEMDIAQSTALSVLQALPEVLAGPAARTWAVYEALVRAPAGP